MEVEGEKMYLIYIYCFLCTISYSFDLRNKWITADNHHLSNTNTRKTPDTINNIRLRPYSPANFLQKFFSEFPRMEYNTKGEAIRSFPRSLRLHIFT